MYKIITVIPNPNLNIDEVEIPIEADLARVDDKKIDVN